MKDSVFIIAEAGVNHNGSSELAKQLIDQAFYAGADIVKFQSFKASSLVSASAKKAHYQQKNIDIEDTSQFRMLKSLELGEQEQQILFDYSKKKGIDFLSTGYDEESIDFLEKLGISQFKIPSGELTNKPLIEHISKKGKPVILSTGMATLEEVNKAITIILESGLARNKITILHCNTEYPTPMKDVNLLAMLTMRDEFGVKIGYSDHTEGIEIPIAAVALGAKVIEKHFTLDRKMPGPDHKASLEPKELRAMVKAIRNIEQAISGNGEKTVSPSEIQNRNIVRKSIHVKTQIKAGDRITRDTIIMKRPGDGISPMDIDDVITMKARVDMLEDHKIGWEDLIR